jgi:lantibiotic biosynthesis protein
VGTLLGEEELLGEALQMLQRMARENHEEREFDLLAGMAGAVAALVVLRDILDEVSLLDFASRLGDELLEAADKNETEYSWRSINFPDQPNLTGFSHGAAGVGYALLELFQATRNPSYRHAAEQAFAYERQWFDKEAGNWPDLRTESGRRRDVQSQPSFAAAWCHGAPGIALARLRAYELDKDDTYKAEALTALQTTHEAVGMSLHARTGPYSLCHGLAGNADILLQGFRVLGQERADDATLARHVACAGIGRYMQRGQEWPCGPSGETPGLMLGLAGIGYFYLRLYDPTHPSVLILQRESF